MNDDSPARRPIRVGISACLLGEAVRFDGGHKRDPFLTETFGAFVEWVPVCPEVECGFGTPREAMRLVRVDERRAAAHREDRRGSDRPCDQKLATDRRKYFSWQVPTGRDERRNVAGFPQCLAAKCGTTCVGLIAVIRHSAR